MDLKFDRFIPPGFRDTFLAHVLINRAKAENPKIKANPILAIAGPSGVGKTSNSYALAKALGCEVYSVQGSDLVAQLEGQGTEMLVKALRDAADDTTSLMPLVLIDDADLGGLGHNPNITGTVNGEAVKGCVMAWADNPNEVKVDDGRSPQRIIPLRRPACMIMTTNRLDNLYPPMLGNQRANVMTFAPHGQDLQHVLAGLFPKLSAQNVRLLMTRFPDQPVSFFASLKAAVATRAAVEQAYQFDGDWASANWTEFGALLEELSEGASYEDLLAEGEKIASQSRDANFVHTPKPTRISKTEDAA